MSIGAAAHFLPSSRLFVPPFSDMRRRAFALSLILRVGSGCADEERPSETLIVRDGCDGVDAGLVCLDGVALSCRDGDITSKDDCGSRGLSCSTSRGCEVCRPGFFECDGNTVMRCSDDGLSRTVEKVCPPETACGPLGCSDLCADAEKERSYLGCDYWAAFTLNSLLDPVFRPAIVIGNPQYVAAHVSVSRGGQVVAEVDVPASSASTLMIPRPTHEPLRTAASTLLARQAAYHVVSSAPVLVHQFNPLLFEAAEECALLGEDEEPDGLCNSFTNDASLLLPSHVLTREDGTGITYLGVSRASFSVTQGEMRAGYSGFLALVAVGDRPVNVSLRSSAHTKGGDELAPDGVTVVAPPEPEAMDAGAADDGGLAGDGGLNPSANPANDAGAPARRTFAELAPGDRQELTLNPGDVFQLLTRIPDDCPGHTGTTGRLPSEVACDPGAAYDLTGSEIEADGPLQLIGGHDCSYVPFDQIACDHLEETVFPLETWGQRVIVGSVGDVAKARYRLRVVSGADDNQVTFDPPISGPKTLARGEWVELATKQNVLVTGTRPLLVAQYLEGQGSVSRNGDPSLTFVPPVEQYRDYYNFLSPETYTSNYVTIIAPVGENVLLDGNSVLGFDAVGETGYAIATVKLEFSGAHELYSEGAAPVGISLYGFGAYTSYMLPGGLDLQIIADIF